MKLITVCTILAAAWCATGCTGAAGTDKKTFVATDSLYTCLPCGYGCDTLTYKNPGTCSHCNMQLVNKTSIRFGTIQPQEICSFIAGRRAGNVVLLDVRTQEEFNGTAPEKFGRLTNAINIPAQQLEQRLHELDSFKNKTIVVYCSHSHRSPRASYLLNQNGFEQVYNMALGMSEWRSQVTAKDCNSNYYINQ